MSKRRGRARRLAALLGAALVSAGCASIPARSSHDGPTSVTTAPSTRSGLAPLRRHVSVPRPAFSLRSIGHVFVIVLENESEQNAFGYPDADPYLARTLRREGLFLPDYYAIGHYSADNYIALVSGQPPNESTQDDCGTFVPFATPRVLPGGIQAGDGCVYPRAIANIGTELSAAGRSWKAYEQDMGERPSREPAACAHPAIGAPDRTENAVRGDGYTTRHDPFVYFASVISRRGYCDAHVVALGSPQGSMPKAALRGETGLFDDLRSVRTTPSFSFITPDLCSDGHDYPCVNRRSGQSAFADVDSFLRSWVPIIEASAAFRRDGLLVITFDEAAGGEGASASCCGERPDPGAIPPVPPGIDGPGGGRVGAVLISPFIRRRTVDKTDYNHYSMLATFEDIFGLRRLGFSALTPPIPA
ncbi:MAG: alkaline phosphatase family protein, partial [Acidimicrobiales bacterium]